MSNEIILPDHQDKHSLAIFESISATKYLPRIQLFSAKSQVVSEGKFPMNHYGIVINKNTVIDLGEQVDVLPLAWRPKALDTNNDTPIAAYDHTSPEFLRIQEASGTPNSGCMYGPEFLLWVPSKSKFASFMMGTISARIESTQMMPLMRKGATLKSKWVKNQRYGWQTPVILPCSSISDLPDEEELKRQVHQFENPPKTETEEEVPDGEVPSSRDR